MTARMAVPIVLTLGSNGAMAASVNCAVDQGLNVNNADDWNQHHSCLCSIMTGPPPHITGSGDGEVDANICGGGSGGRGGS